MTFRIVDRFRSLAKRVAYLSIAILNGFAPKRDQALIVGYPDFAPNAIAISNALIEHTDIDVVWLVDDPGQVAPLSLSPSLRLRLLRHQSVRGVFAYARSRFVFTTHGVFRSRTVPNGQVVVQLWHGMPAKSIGAFDRGRSLGGSSWVVAASPFWQPILAAAFDVGLDQVLSIGMPRDELLMQKRSRALQMAVRHLLGGERYTKLLVWLPTYRESLVGEVRLDGSEAGNAVQAKGFDARAVNEALRSTDTVCIVKPHPMASSSGDLSLTHLRFVSDEDLAASRLDLYSLLAMSDGLITDVSSVWIDYLVTNRPIMFFFEDLAEYEQTRGLVLSPYEDYIPGPLLTDAREIPEAIRSFWTEAPLRDHEVDEARQLLNCDSDSETSYRLLDYLGLVSSLE